MRRGVIVGFAVVLAGAGAVVATPARADAALVVTPAVDLLDGQTVHVHADGLPDEAITIEECNGGSCRNLVDGPVTPVAGVVDRDVVIRRRVGALWWMFDECAAAPGQCIIRLRSMTTFATLATAPLDFDESVPLVVPTVSLASSGPFAPGADLGLTGSGFEPGDSALVRWCAPNDRCSFREELTVAADGTLALDVIARTMLDGDPDADCTQPDACVLQVTGARVAPPGIWASLPVVVDPDLPGVTPTATITPNAGLLHGQVVTIAGTGWSGSSQINVSRCWGPGTSGCVGSFVAATATIDGRLIGTVAASRTIGATDCALVAGGCRFRLLDTTTGESLDLPYGLAASDWPRLTARDLTVVEGNSGHKTVSFELRLDRAPTEPVTVRVTERRTDTEGDADYYANPPVVFEPGQVRKALKLWVTGDTTDEIDEFLELTLVADRAIAIDVHPRLTITDDDRAPWVHVGNATDVETDAARSAMCVPVRLSAASERIVRVGYTTFGGTATANVDYEPASLLYNGVTFAPGVVSQQLCITVFGDRRREPAETVTIVAIRSSRAFIKDAVGILTIANDD